MSSPESSNADFMPAAASLLRQAGIDAASFDLTPASGGANNQVYRVELEGRAPLVLKRYFFSPADKRDRFHSEKSFYDFIIATGQPMPIAQPLAWDREQRLGIFTWIEGHKLEPTEINQAAVDQALGFYLGLNAHQNIPEATAAPTASEACFTLAEHFATVARRLARLATIDPASPLGGEASEFVSTRLRPAFEKYQRACSRHIAADMNPLGPNKRCLSPSDFGFHNALLQSNGRFVFFDFEYAGWDDPAKFLCDFLCQPALPVPQSLWAHCWLPLQREIPGGTTADRIGLLLPLYQLKWCCILLNEFLPQEQNRRAFSLKLSTAEIESKKRGQLDKATALFQRFD